MSVEKERRTAGGRRIPIKTLVEIGAGEGGSAAFEAESVDVNPSGMHLRTAYLPEVGEPLLCRFEANGKEIVVQGEVAWRNEEACGGDFGVRFAQMEEDAIQALRELAGEPAEEEPQVDEGEEQAPAVQRGTRVRLHIEGLASPMKARVREANPAEIMVGSNLEFLKVGRPLELENIDVGDKREAKIERVNIEVDPASKIPQLVVALRYLDAPDAAEVEQPVSRRPEPSMRLAESEEGVVDETDEDLARKAGKPEALWNRLKQFGPVLAGFGGKAKSVMSNALDKAKSLRSHSDDNAQSPLRVTSPAPAGVLRSGGRKGVVRDEPSSDEAERIPVPGLKKIPKKAVIIGAASLVLLVAVYALARKPSNPPGTAALPAGSAPAAQSADDSLTGAPNGPVVANVPLFGPTPMTTTEPAASPPNTGTAAAATPPPGDKLAAAANAAQEGGGEDESGEDASGGGDDGAKDKSDSKASSGSSSGGSKSFVHGKVKNPVVLAVRMSGPIKSVKGMTTATGFTVHLSGAQAKDSAAGLAHKDPRIATLKLTNKGNGADLTVQFKDGVPSYAVRGVGSNLQIAIGRPADKSDDKKTAKAPKAHHRKGKHSKH